MGISGNRNRFSVGNSRMKSIRIVTLISGRNGSYPAPELPGGVVARRPITFAPSKHELCSQPCRLWVALPAVVQARGLRYTMQPGRLRYTVGWLCIEIQNVLIA